MSEDQVQESIAALEQRGYLRDVIHGIGEPYPAGGRLSQYGFEQFLCKYMPNEYRNAKIAVVSEIVNRKGHSSRMMVYSLNIHEAIVEHIITDLENADHVIASHHSEGISIHPKPTLRRILQELEADGDVNS